MNRKEFIKSGCQFCMVGAAALILPAITGCGSASNIFKTTVTDNKIEMPLSLFEKSALQFVRPNGWGYDIAVHKKEDNSYTALLMRCTHQNNPLDISSNGFNCSLHGSNFDKEGNVKKGPAATNLKRYTTSIVNNNLIINL